LLEICGMKSREPNERPEPERQTLAAFTCSEAAGKLRQSVDRADIADGPKGTGRRGPNVDIFV
jgi:hypothetical protein